MRRGDHSGFGKKSGYRKGTGLVTENILQKEATSASSPLLSEGMTH